MQKVIILSTLNARYTHASLGLRYLYANLGALQAQAEIVEFTLAMQPLDIAEQLLSKKPRIIGLGVYIWNVLETRTLVGLLKVLAPETVVVLGGPEVSHETTAQPWLDWADYVVTGPGEVRFRQLCEAVLQGQRPEQAVLAGENVALQQLQLPYDAYTDDDLRNRAVYVEASRGCPFKCEFCLSALDKTAYPFALEPFLAAMQRLWERGLRQFRFVDRTFNLNTRTTTAILDFFLERLDARTFLHFELVPDHLPPALRERITRFPPGSLQFEIGIQTFNPQVQALISRRQDNVQALANLRWLRDCTHAHLHTDLIFGLPGETLESFGAGFDQLIANRPHEIQVGILKRLRGAPINRHTTAFGMNYNPQPPYNILRTDCVDFATTQQMQRFARYWDMIGNSGRFACTLPLLLAATPFKRFWNLSVWLYATTGQTHQIALPRLFECVYRGAQEALGVTRDTLEPAMLEDYARTGQKGRVPFGETPRKNPPLVRKDKPDSRQSRQQRHV